MKKLQVAYKNNVHEYVMTKLPLERIHRYACPPIMGDRDGLRDWHPFPHLFDEFPEWDGLKSWYSDLVSPRLDDHRWSSFQQAYQLARSALSRQYRRLHFEKVQRRSTRSMTNVYRAFFVTTVLAEQQGRCHWCGVLLTHVADCEVDHVVPFSKGGRHERDNLVITCLTCNQAKGDKDPDEYARIATKDLL